MNCRTVRGAPSVHDHTLIGDNHFHRFTVTDVRPMSHLTIFKVHRVEPVFEDLVEPQTHQDDSAIHMIARRWGYPTSDTTDR